jgi:GNAT superfamily N-acetyltransferase
MDLDIRIRLATAADAERIAQLLDTFRRELGQTAQASVPLPVHQDGPQYVLLCEVSGANHESHPVGVASLQRCHHLVRGTNFLLLTDIYVQEDYRRHGVATSLLSECIALGRRQGCAALTMIARDHDKPMLATAARAGFVKHPDLLLDLDLTV